MISTKHFELVFWVAALTSLAFTHLGTQHFSLCPLSNLGFSWCAGCGLGRSVASILHGEILASFSYHWFGLPALVILIHRIIVLLKNTCYISEKPKHSQA